MTAKQFLAAGVLLVAVPALASDPKAELDLARNWAQKGQYDKALSAYRSLADGGNAEAAFQIGLLYEHGLGVNQDASQAASWYERAIPSKHNGAMRQLASLYFEGRGVQVDHAKAAELLSVAASQNDAQAKTFLAYMYENGYGVEKNLPIAIRLLQEAADAGHPPAQNALGIMYWRGAGVQKDNARAYSWWILASEGGDKIASENRERLARSLPPEVRMQGEALATEYRRRTRPHTR